jgi:hypothetical protein
LLKDVSGRFEKTDAGIAAFGGGFGRPWYNFYKYHTVGL